MNLLDEVMQDIGLQKKIYEHFLGKEIPQGCKGLYQSPLRDDDSTSSFSIFLSRDKKAILFKDHGINESGNVIRFLQIIFNKDMSKIKDFLNGLMGNSIHMPKFKKQEQIDTNSEEEIALACLDIERELKFRLAHQVLEYIEDNKIEATYFDIGFLFYILPNIISKRAIKKHFLNINIDNNDGYDKLLENLSNHKLAGTSFRIKIFRHEHKTHQEVKTIFNLRNTKEYKELSINFYNFLVEYFSKIKTSSIFKTGHGDPTGISSITQYEWFIALLLESRYGLEGREFNKYYGSIVMEESLNKSSNGFFKFSFIRNLIKSIIITSKYLKDLIDTEDYITPLVLFNYADINSELNIHSKGSYSDYIDSRFIYKYFPKTKITNSNKLEQECNYEHFNELIFYSNNDTRNFYNTDIKEYVSILANVSFFSNEFIKSLFKCFYYPLPINLHTHISGYERSLWETDRLYEILTLYCNDINNNSPTILINKNKNIDFLNSIYIDSSVKYPDIFSFIGKSPAFNKFKFNDVIPFKYTIKKYNKNECLDFIRGYQFEIEQNFIVSQTSKLYNPRHDRKSKALYSHVNNNIYVPTYNNSSKLLSKIIYQFLHNELLNSLPANNEVQDYIMKMTGAILIDNVDDNINISFNNIINNHLLYKNTFIEQFIDKFKEYVNTKIKPRIQYVMCGGEKDAYHLNKYMGLDCFENIAQIPPVYKFVRESNEMFRAGISINDELQINISDLNIIVPFSMNSENVPVNQFTIEHLKSRAKNIMINSLNAQTHMNNPTVIEFNSIGDLFLTDAIINELNQNGNNWMISNIRRNSDEHLHYINVLSFGFMTNKTKIQLELLRKIKSIIPITLINNLIKSTSYINSGTGHLVALSDGDLKQYSQLQNGYYFVIQHILYSILVDALVDILFEKSHSEISFMLDIDKNGAGQINHNKHVTKLSTEQLRIYNNNNKSVLNNMYINPLPLLMNYIDDNANIKDITEYIENELKSNINNKKDEEHNCRTKLGLYMNNTIEFYTSHNSICIPNIFNFLRYNADVYLAGTDTVKYYNTVFDLYLTNKEIDFANKNCFGTEELFIIKKPDEIEF